MAPVVILTGASRGIGLSALQFLLKAGCSVVTLSRTVSTELKLLAANSNDKLIIVKGDVALEADSAEAVKQCLAHFGRIDSLLLNAGTLSPLGRIESYATADRINQLKTLFDINYFSLVTIIAQALPALKAPKQGQHAITGRIVLVSSGASTGLYPGWGAYCGSKAAMNALAATLSVEEPSIVSISVRPGVVDTAMQLAIRETGADHMDKSDHIKFTSFHEQGQLLHVDQPSAVLAGLAINAKPDCSGKYVSWDDQEMEQYAL